MLDLSRVLAGPFCAMNLADLGAEVIKIELPGRGDDSRGFAPRIPNSNDSGYYYSVNRGKLSVTLDLRQPAGVAVALDLVRHCDVVVENFCAGHDGAFRPGLRGTARGQPAHHPVLDFGLRADRPDGLGAGLRHRRAGARRHDEHHRTSGRRPDAMRRVDRRSGRGALRRDRDPGGAAGCASAPASDAIWISRCSIARSRCSRTRSRAIRRPARCPGRSARAIRRSRPSSSSARPTDTSSRAPAMNRYGRAFATRSDCRN